MKRFVSVMIAGGILATGAFAGEVETALAAFDEQVKTVLATKEGADEKALEAAMTLKAKLQLADLPALEAFAAKREDGYKWISVRVFVEFKELSAIPRLLTPVLAKKSNAEARRYSMWKFWEYNFGERKDFTEVTAKLGVAFADHYEKADVTARKVIAETFGQRAGTPAEFRRFIEQKAAPATEENFR